MVFNPILNSQDEPKYSVFSQIRTVQYEEDGHNRMSQPFFETYIEHGFMLNGGCTVAVA